MLVTHAMEENKAEKVKGALNKYYGNKFFCMKLTTVKQR